MMVLDGLSEHSVRLPQAGESSLLFMLAFEIRKAQIRKAKTI